MRVKGRKKQDVDQSGWIDNYGHDNSIREFYSLMNNMYNKVYNFQELLNSLSNWGAVLYGENILRAYDEKKTGKNILLVSHEASLTGGPIVLFNFAKVLRSRGDNVLFLSRNDDSLREELLASQIPFAVYGAVYDQPMVVDWTNLFDIVIINTLEGAGLVKMLAGTEVPVLWWIHETEAAYRYGMVEHLPQYLPRNIKIYCGGSRPATSLRIRRPLYKTNELLYYIPDTMSAFKAVNFPMHEKTTFLCIGSVEYRKGQDILTEAFQRLPKSDVDKARLVFVGRVIHSHIYKKIVELQKKYPLNVFYVPQYSPDRLRELELRSQCLVCPSRDDPMPCVITDMLMMSKVIITSDNTGQSTYINETESGYVYENNDPDKLSGLISYVINNRDKIYSVQREARRLYDKLFTKEIFLRNAGAAIQETIDDCNVNDAYSISVIIPTYNGLEDMQNLVPALKKQRRVNLKEIIVIDSGSTDGTDLYVQREKCKLIKIKKEQFSHSFSRNLGASKASGKYLLFMTQDALPEDEYWLGRMLYPLKAGICTAVSCQQIPRTDCDLYGTVNTLLHARYMMYPEGDRITSNPPIWNRENVRKNAQLEDVACLISAEAFERFKYRGDYAEDLDLGIRLLQNGHFLGLLGTVRVIHSHNRPAYYYLKRALVENAVLNKILPNGDAQILTKEKFVNCIITAYLLVKRYVQHILTFGETEISAYRNDLNNQLGFFMEEVSALRIQDIRKELTEAIPLNDGDIRQIVTRIFEISEDYEIDTSGVNDVLYFTEHYLLDYLEKRGTYLTGEVKNEFCIAIEKHLGTVIGTAMSQYEPNNNDGLLKAVLEECKKGV